MNSSGKSKSQAIFGVYALAAAACFGAVTYLDRKRRLDKINTETTQVLQKHKSKAIDQALAVPSALGYAPQVYGISAGLILFLYAFGKKVDALMALGAMGASFLAGGVIKRLAKEPRPKRPMVRKQRSKGGESYPSGHVLYFTAFYGYAAYLAATQIASRGWRALSLGLLGTAIAASGVSRIYRGEHWIADVSAGYLVGSAILALTLIARQAIGMSGQADRYREWPRYQPAKSFSPVQTPGSTRSETTE
ncbi:MAG: phosphatase PAP2 family protein, partial [Rudaea sp.]